jgi:hypothetical protein
MGDWSGEWFGRLLSAAACCSFVSGGVFLLPPQPGTGTTTMIAGKGPAHPRNNV